VQIISGTGYMPDTAGLQPLTVKHTYASSCLSHWSQPYPDSLRSSTLLYSTLGAQYSLDKYFASCQPGGYATTYARYSPGICPSGRTIAIITESRTVPVASDGSGRVWLGACCPRYVANEHPTSNAVVAILSSAASHLQKRSELY